MNSIGLVLLAVLCNVGAQVALKLGAAAPLDRWQNWLSPALLTGVLLYSVSFVLTVRLYALFPLSLISPLMAGAIFLLVSLSSTVFLAEPLGVTKIAGMLLIVGGIALLSHSA